MCMFVSDEMRVLLIFSLLRNVWVCARGENFLTPQINDNIWWTENVFMKTCSLLILNPTAIQIFWDRCEIKLYTHTQRIWCIHDCKLLCTTEIRTIYIDSNFSFLELNNFTFTTTSCVRVCMCVCVHYTCWFTMPCIKSNRSVYEP